MMKRERHDTKMTRVLGCLLLCATLTAPACGDSQVSPQGTDGGMALDQGTSAKQTFGLEVLVKIDPKLACSNSDPSKDCKGNLAWMVLDGPLDLAHLPQVLGAGVLNFNGKETRITAKKVRLAPKMYLLVFLDDNGTATPKTPWPDKGDLIYLDLKPFSAKPAALVKRTVVLWARLP